MTTPMDFMRGASWLAKQAASWSGEVACNVQGKIYEPNEPMSEEVLSRFRTDIMRMLDSIAPPT